VTDHAGVKNIFFFMQVSMMNLLWDFFFVSFLCIV